MPNVQAHRPPRTDVSKTKTPRQIPKRKWRFGAAPCSASISWLNLNDTTIILHVMPLAIAKHERSDCIIETLDKLLMSLPRSEASPVKSSIGILPQRVLRVGNKMGRGNYFVTSRDDLATQRALCLATNDEGHKSNRRAMTPNVQAQRPAPGSERGKHAQCSNDHDAPRNPGAGAGSLKRPR